MWGTGTKYSNDPTVLKLINRTARGEEQRDEGREVSAHFTRWLRGSPWRAEAEETYNRTFFGHAERRQSADALEIGGLAKTFIDKDGVERKVELHGYQNEGIRWAANQRRGILAYDVGLGKTFTAIALVRHLRESQGVRKPCVVVPKSVARNWLAEFEVLHPGAKVLVIGESRTTDKKGKVTAKSDNAETIALKMADAAANDYDAVIVTRDAFARIPVREETIAEHEDRDFWATRAKKLDDLGSKGADAGSKLREKMRAAYDKQRADLSYGHKKAVVHWEDLGCDCLVVDEAHGYKNLNAAQDRWGSSPKFLGGSGTAKRASDMEMKAAAVRLRRRPGESDADHEARKARGAGDGVFFLTATPTKNSPLELYNMLQYVSPDVWTDRGIRNAEEFLDRYCTFAQRSVLNKDGEIVQASAVVGFQNMHEIRDVMATMLRLRTARDVGLTLPEVDEHVHMVDMTAEQHAAYEAIRAEAERAAKSNDENEKQGATFRAMDQMRKASMDLTLLDAEAHPEGWKASPKYNTCADRVADGVKTRGGQIVFVDSNDSHERLAQLLVARGIPRNRIGILNAETAEDSETRYEIGQAFRDGSLDVVIGNTGVMGEGVNLQDKTTDIHHLDLPWEPGTMQQRNGRGVRQGNKNAKIAIHTYLAKQSFDGFKYGTLKGKSGWMEKLLSGVETAANDFDETAVSEEERMIMLAADPDAARAEYEKNKASAIEKHAAAARVRALRRVEKLQAMKASLAKLTPNTAAHTDLAQKVEMEMRAVRRDGSVPVAVRHALDHNQPIVANETGHVFAFNAVVEEPHKGDDTAHRLWRVQEVDPTTRKVKLARFASDSPHNDTFTLDDIKGWATLDDPPDEDAERVRVAREGLSQRPKEMYRHQRHDPYGVLHGIPQGRAEQMRDEIHDAYRAAVSRQSYGSVPVFEADGAITAVPCQDVGDRRLVLPFGEDRRKLAVALKHGRGKEGEALSSAVQHAFGTYYDRDLSREAP
jgi:superfamily II DNA or RNA helicase